MWPIIVLFLLFVGALASLFIVMKSSQDPYHDEFHLNLNALPGLKPGQRPTTEWLNMGFWKDTDRFPEACEALALRLVHASRSKEGGRVLDVGHGSGDSLLLQVSHPSVPRPSLLVGITSLPQHHKRSEARLLRALEQSGAKDINTHLFQSDAVYIVDSRSKLGSRVDVHPLSPSSPSTFDTIVALDCAYHFHTRALFLQQSFAKLSPGGHIALADIYFASTTKSTPPSKTTSPLRPSYPITFFLSTLLRVIPRENVVTKAQYIAEMERVGYVDVEIDDITEYVFPGFVRFLSGRGGGWKVFAWMMAWLHGRGARFGIVVGTKPNS
ncbi:S-adenosyl-L-methionine-dependent methyltransferase [Stereum hirsutum FP-91666 SS1]|uniref:S-adenosyl-L-methionine-dependent methyltransferase n=1 Tax=Stereum hirsutum (strain FP-91666) TaxID=721885 RepID=UPI000440C92A|nr:S-adenosyl-L-methionine-dependent methyltransferase [Stereum hirsutum FP-91666 SS1]EIM92462.1 S-adenosyl-L-methionine-dependent methyltransferase [Stereum hirsutum FP-91666 SS1]